MVFRNSRSITRWRQPPPKKFIPNIDRTPGAENHLIFPYDGEFFAAYGDFLEATDRVGNRHDLREDDRVGLFALTNLAQHLDIMVQEASGITDLTEAFMDDCHATLPESAAADFLDVVCDFHNLNIRPYGFELLRDIEADMEGFMISEVVPLREEDSMVITVVNLSE